MTLPQADKRYTYEDYLSWTEDERWELIEGIPYMQAAPSWQHQAITFELGRQFGNYLIGKSCRVFTAPFDLVLSKDESNKSSDVVQPDLLVICNKNGLKGTGYFGVPDLIVEVCSPSTIRNDKVLKFNKYENAGVKEYWIVEPEGNDSNNHNFYNVRYRSDFIGPLTKKIIEKLHKYWRITLNETYVN